MSSETALDSIRAQLETERENLTAQLAELGFGEDEGSALSYDPNFADTSQVTAERGEAAALAASLQETLDEINLAISKLGSGTFGACDRCGKSISIARLEAMPTSRLCIECASRK